MFGKIIKRRVFLKTISISLAGLFTSAIFCGCSNSSKNPESSPNLIIIFTDDQGYGDLGVFGAADIATPNIDRMAREGIQFTSFYVGGAV